MVKNIVKRFAFMTLFEKSIVNKKTQCLWYGRSERQPYKTSLFLLMLIVNRFEIEANFKNRYDFDPFCRFCRIEDGALDHIFTCESGLLCKNSLKIITC